MHIGTSIIQKNWQELQLQALSGADMKNGAAKRVAKRALQSNPPTTRQIPDYSQIPRPPQTRYKTPANRQIPDYSQIWRPPHTRVTDLTHGKIRIYQGGGPHRDPSGGGNSEDPSGASPKGIAQWRSPRGIPQGGHPGDPPAVPQVIPPQGGLPHWIPQQIIFGVWKLTLRPC